jgi:site-specific DNA recombinase
MCTSSFNSREPSLRLHRRIIGVNGCYYYKGKDTDNRKQSELKDNRLVLAPHQGIVSAPLWLTCRMKCLKNKQIQPARKVVNTWLAGLVKCGNCHYALTFKKYKTKRSRYLLCSHKMNAKACPGAGTIYAEAFEGMIYEQMAQKLAEFAVLLKDEEAVTEKPEITALRIELNQVRQETEALMEKVALANEELMALINRRIEDLLAKQKNLEERLAKDAIYKVDDAGIRQIKDYLNQWNVLSLDDKRSVAGSLVEVIYATSEKVDIYWKI